MRNINKGFGLIGLLITIAIIAVMVFAAQNFMGPGKKNQIEAGRDAIDQAQDAADAQKERSIFLQNEIADPPPVNYHGIQDKLKDLK